MTKKKVLLLIGAAFLLLSFTGKKRKGAVEVGPLAGNNLFAKRNSILFASPFGEKIMYNFSGGEFLQLIKDDIDDYFVEFVKPGGTIIRGYINKQDVNIQ